MFKHILVPTDLTERSIKALEIAVRMAKQEEGRVILMHVIEVIEDTECGEFDDFYKKLGRRAQRKMEKMIGGCSGEPVQIEKQIVYGKRIGSIISYVVENGIDLIVLASHKLEMEDTTQGWGTISFKVGILAPCPVMLVK